MLLLPGPASAVLLLTVAFKLRMYKYDFLEEQRAASSREPEAGYKPPRGRRLRVRVPWDALLAEDREQVGVRTVRGMIFPWKE